MFDLNTFKDPKRARKLIGAIEAVAPEHATLMEVCGTHTVSIARFGIRNVMPAGTRLASGPGCPVCVTANEDIDVAIALARTPDAIIATFGDMTRVPGSTSSLNKEKAQGRDIRVVYSPLDALAIAKANPERQVIFLGVGFETTTPLVAIAIKRAKAEGLANFSRLGTRHGSQKQHARVREDDGVKRVLYMRKHCFWDPCLVPSLEKLAFTLAILKIDSGA